jgi:ATP-dependent Clp protease ATP-binding subunit ClpC
MFERFTDRARRTLVLAQDEARRLGHDFLGTEHVLLGLIAEGEGVAAKAMEELGVSLEDVRRRVMEVIPSGTPGAPGVAPPFTPRAKRVLELSLREALTLGHNYIGTEHVLLGLVREGEGVASQVLVATGLSAAQVRDKVIEILTRHGVSPSLTAPPVSVRQTPAVNLLSTRAKAAAGIEPVGSHHYLLGLLEDSSSLAARILQSFGVTSEAVRTRISEMGTAGTTDQLPPPPKPMLRIDLGEGVTLHIDDPALVEQVRGQVTAPGPNDLGERIRSALAAWLVAQQGTDPPAPEEGTATG